jgi:hypothetical protein
VGREKENGHVSFQGGMSFPFTMGYGCVCTPTHGEENYSYPYDSSDADGGGAKAWTSEQYHMPSWRKPAGARKTRSQ